MTAQGGALTLAWSRMALPLEHVHYDIFRAASEPDEVDEEVSFALDSNGEVATMKFFGETFARK